MKNAGSFKWLTDERKVKQLTKVILNYFSLKADLFLKQEISGASWKAENILQL